MILDSLKNHIVPLKPKPLERICVGLNMRLTIFISLIFLLVGHLLIAQPTIDPELRQLIEEGSAKIGRAHV